MGSDSEENKLEKISYLQPEILSVDLMISLLRQLGASSPSLNSLERKEITEIFCKHLTPKPQRYYNDKRFSKILLKNQKRLKLKNGCNNQNDTYNVVPNNKLEQKNYKHRLISAPVECLSENKRFKSNLAPSVLPMESKKRSCSELHSPSKKMKQMVEKNPSEPVNQESKSPSKKNKNLVTWP